MVHHGAGLRRLTKDDTLAGALAGDYEAVPIDDADKVMLRYVDKLTRTPAKMTKQDVTTLRDAGFSESAVLDICQVAGYYAFVNRLADGLGVDLEAPEVFE